MSDSTQTNTPAQEAQEIEEVMAELERYRERIVNDVLEMAKKVKISKQTVMAQLANHPEIAQIEAMLSDLRSRKAAIEAASTVQ
jgi:uncharacterized protein YPO0396